MNRASTFAAPDFSGARLFRRPTFAAPTFAATTCKNNLKKTKMVKRCAKKLLPNKCEKTIKIMVKGGKLFFHRV